MARRQVQWPRWGILTIRDWCFGDGDFREGVSCLERSVKGACNELPGYCKRSVAKEPYAQRKKNTPGFPRALLPDQCGLWDHHGRNEATHRGGTGPAS